MTTNALTPTDPRVHQVELIISTLLRVGVTLSLAVIVFGTIVTFVHHPDYRTSHEQLVRMIHPPAEFPKTVGETWAGLRQFRGQAIVVLGLMLLVATPIVRVAVSIFAFWYEGDL